MASDAQQMPDFESVKRRLAEIAEAVDDESLSLDDALDLYEEAVALGLQASDLLESGVEPADEEPEDGRPGNSAPEFGDEPDLAGGATSGQA